MHIIVDYLRVQDTTRGHGLTTTLIKSFSAYYFYAGVMTTINSTYFRSLWSELVLQESVCSCLHGGIDMADILFKISP